MKKKKKERKKNFFFKKIQEAKIHAIRYFPAGSFAVHIGDHLRFGIICGPIWGSIAVWGSFAVGDHLRRCTDPSFASILTILSIVMYTGGFLRIEVKFNKQKDKINQLESVVETMKTSNSDDIAHGKLV